MTTIVFIIIVALLFVFRNQVKGFITWGKKIADNKLPTSVKAKQAIEDIRLKRKELRSSRKSIEKNIAMIYTNIGNFSSDTEDDVTAKVVVGGNCKHGKWDLRKKYKVIDILKSEMDNHYDVKLQYDKDNIVPISLECIELSSDGMLERKLEQLYKILEKSVSKRDMIVDITVKMDATSKNLQRELDYVMAMEGLEDIGDFTASINLDALYAEITALDKMLEV